VARARRDAAPALAPAAQVTRRRRGRSRATRSSTSVRRSSANRRDPRARSRCSVGRGAPIARRGVEVPHAQLDRRHSVRLRR
jgi:hypothetical protein